MHEPSQTGRSTPAADDTASSPPPSDTPVPEPSMTTTTETVPIPPVGSTSSQTVSVSNGPTPVPAQDHTPQVLAYGIVLGFFAVLAGLLFVDVAAGMSSTLSIMLGALTAGVGQVISYYFGSSSGSTRKTELLGNERRAP